MAVNGSGASGKAKAALRKAGRATPTYAEVVRLRRRVRKLSEEVQECRRLHERVAELTDVVAELLVPAVDRDDERVQRALQEFSRSSY